MNIVTRVVVCLALACAAILAGSPRTAQAQGTCAIYKTYVAGDTFAASDINSIQTILAGTNAITTCVDDDSVDAATMQSTTDPYPADTVSLSTTLQGELRRLRYVVKKLTGWTQWYAHSEAFIFPNAFRFSSVGPHAIGGATATNVQLGVLGTFTNAGAHNRAVDITTSVTGATGGWEIYGLRVAPTLIEAASDIHANIIGLLVAPVITAGAGTTTVASAVKIAALAAATGTTTAVGLLVSAPTGATNLATIWADSGNVRFDGSIGMGVHSAGSAGSIQWNATTDTGPSILGTAATLRFKGGTTDTEWYNQANATELMRLTDVGNLKIGGSAARATTEGTNKLELFDGTAPVGTLAAGISLYSTSGELRVMDSAGNPTLLSPHDRVTNEWIFLSKNARTGLWLRVDLERFFRWAQARFGLEVGAFVHEWAGDEHSGWPAVNEGAF